MLLGGRYDNPGAFKGVAMVIEMAAKGLLGCCWGVAIEFLLVARVLVSGYLLYPRLLLEHC